MVLIFVPKMHQNTFGGRAPPGPAGEDYALHQSPYRNGGLLLNRWRVREEEGLISKKDRRGGRRKGAEKGIPSQSQVH